jgi:UDP-N-acetylmuramate--alanine ligase
MLKSLHNVHLMGIGGAGMSGLARLLHEMGFAVSGCDVTSTSYVERVLERGIPFLSDIPQTIWKITRGASGI